MTLPNRLTLAAIATASLILSACGGGGGDILAGGGVSGTGITSGSVTGFGSVIANERVHETDANTEFDRNGDPSTQDDFRVGDVVVIEWESDDGGVTRNATRVSYQRELFGEVTAAPDEVAGTVGVLGQVVRADATTVFDDFPLSPLPGDIFPQGLVTGNCVEATGFRDSNGDLFATRIEFKGATCADPVELRGVIDSIGTGNTIVVSGTTVNTLGAVITPAGTILAADQLVEVTGDFSGSVLDADTIEVRDDDLSGLEDDDVDIEGLISGFSGSFPDASFTVSGTIPVITNSETQYENGSFADLADDIRVEAEGSFTGGVLVADKIKFKLDGSIKMETVVLDANGTTGEVTLRYENETLLVLTDPLITQLRDKTGTIPLPFGVDDLSAGDFVEIAAFLDGDDIVASKLELEDLAAQADTDRVLQGPITEITGSPIPSSIEILGLDGVRTGVTIPTGDNLTDCEDAAGNPVIPCSDLVATLQVGDIVKVKGDEDIPSGTIEWDELELEDEDD